MNNQVDSGSLNSGDWNSGSYNSGSLNSGDCNSGNRNSGSWNSGSWNSGDCNSGYFNTETPKEILVFGKPCDRKVWEEAFIPNCLRFELTEWVDDDSKAEGGYVKTYGYKEAFKRSMENASQQELEQVKALPNFDADIFYEISGYKFDDKKTIEIDGKKIELSQDSYEALKRSLLDE